MVAKNGNNVEATFDFVEATFDLVERIVRPLVFDNVASILLLVWTGLKLVRHRQARKGGQINGASG